MSGVLKNTLIPISGGEVVAIEDVKLSQNYYSLNKDCSEVINDKIADISEIDFNGEVYKIEFYNGTYIIVAPDQEVMMLDGKSRKANKLHIGEHVMPFSLEKKINTQTAFDSRSYFIIKQIKRLQNNKMFVLKPSNQHKAFAVVTRKEFDNQPNDFGGCFLKG